MGLDDRDYSRSPDWQERQQAWESRRQRGPLGIVAHALVALVAGILRIIVVLAVALLVLAGVGLWLSPSYDLSCDYSKAIARGLAGQEYHCIIE